MHPVEVEVPSLDLSAYRRLIGDERMAKLLDGVTRAKEWMGERAVWSISSTALGGGVAEMLQVLVGYARGAGVDARWMAIEGDADFFVITKRLHNRIHGMPGDGGSLGPAEAAHYAEVLERNNQGLDGRLRPDDVVLLHDPQTAGLVAPLEQRGLRVVWRSHIGADRANRWTEEAWAFLRPFLQTCRRFVFSRSEFAQPWMDPTRVSIIPPSIDPFSPKNQPIAPKDLPVVLAQVGLWAGPSQAAVSFRRHDGSVGQLMGRATIVADEAPWPADTNPVVQVSRWDHLKDMAGVMEGFVGEVLPSVPSAHLALVGPSTEGVADDPEGAAVYGEVLGRWQRLTPSARRRVALVTIPMDDVDENAVMVNAVQRASSVIVQKSIMEGFGLTVAEGMWKGKPVVASRVGGIIDQVVPGTGILLDDPSDLHAFGEILAGLLRRPRAILRMGAKAHRHVLDAFVGDRHLLALGALLEEV